MSNAPELQKLLVASSNYQERPRPNRWANKVENKLNKAGISSLDDLRKEIYHINYVLSRSNQSQLHPISIQTLEQGINNKDGPIYNTTVTEEYEQFFQYGRL